MKTKKANGANHPAIDKANGGIKLDPLMAGILHSLIAERQAVEEKILYFLHQCASSKGIKLEQYDLNMNTMTFVPKSAARVVVQ